jgi:hypothetical protein
MSKRILLSLDPINTRILISLLISRCLLTYCSGEWSLTNGGGWRFAATVVNLFSSKLRTVRTSALRGQCRQPLPRYALLHQHHTRWNSAHHWLTKVKSLSKSISIYKTPSTILSLPDIFCTGHPGHSLYANSQASSGCITQAIWGISPPFLPCAENPL